jgi:hypothetical protein|tara:strand:+ start:806 stop:1096 length:291 start_codon:yes stop_codon:yes gene_type:complete
MTFTVDYKTKGGLEKLFRRLKKGQILKGRIIDCIEPNGYLLRIRGFNIITQSNGTFEKFEEISLKVREIDSHLVLDFIPKKNRNRKSNGLNSDIIV